MLLDGALMVSPVAPFNSFFFLSLLFWLINLCEDSEIVIMAQYKSHRN